MWKEQGRVAHLAWRRTDMPADLLLLHGFSDSAQCWDPVVPALAERWALAAVDARGHGESDLPDGDYGVDDQSADVAMVLDAFGVGVRGSDTCPGGVVVIGHSMGAVTAATLAASRPDLVRALVLEDPPGEAGHSAASGQAGLPEWLQRARSVGLEQRVAGCRADNPAWPEAELEPWARAKEQLHPEVLRRRRRDQPYLADRLREVRCPVLLVHGEPALGSLMSDRAVQDCVRMTPAGLRAVRVAGAGHNVRRDRPAEFLATVTRFVAHELG